MAAGMNSQKRTVGFKTEVEPGTPETLAAGDCGKAYVFNESFNSDFDKIERSPSAFGGGSLPRLVGTTACSPELEVEVIGSGTAGTPPPMGALLRAAGFTETIAGGSVGYTLTSNHALYQQATVGMWTGEGSAAYLKLSAGTMFDFTLEASGEGKVMMAKFKGKGVFALPVAGEPPANITQPGIALAPHQFKDLTLQLDGNAFCNVSTLSLKSNGTVNMRPCVNSASGLEAAFLKKGTPSFDLDPMDVGLGDGTWADAFTGTPRPLTLVSDKGPGNTFGISIPRWDRGDPREGDRDGERVHELGGICAALNGDDELTLTFS